MDRQHIRDSGVIERYLRGRLSPAEEEAFEEAYLGDPELLQELEVAQRLRDGLRELHGADQPARRRPRWLELMATPRFGIAASVLAAAALFSSGLLYVQNRGLQSGSSPAPRIGASTRLLPLVSVRGGGTPNVIEAPHEDDWTVLLIDAGYSDYDRYRAVLVRRDVNAAAQELLRLDGMTPTYEGFLALGVPGRLLAAGEYEIRLAGGRHDWPADRALDELGRTGLTVTARP
jgi:hypothetical protein